MIDTVQPTLRLSREHTRAAIVFKLLLTILLAGMSNGSFADDCELENRRYVTVGGSEAHIALNFCSGGKVVLEHETWIPGQYEDRSSRRVVGTWSCKGLEVWIRLGEREYSAMFEPVGPNPLRIDPDAIVLRVADIEGIDDLVDGGTFFKEEQLE